MEMQRAGKENANNGRRDSSITNLAKAKDESAVSINQSHARSFDGVVHFIAHALARLCCGGVSCTELHKFKSSQHCHEQ